LNDLWGADGTQPAGSVFPGDDDDWDSYQSFLVNVIAGIQSNSMTDIAIDIWNEPDGGTTFWNGNQAQWLSMWSMGYETLRDALGESVLLFGPTLAGAPETTNTWWTNWLALIASDETVPDAYVWHLEGSTTDPNDDLQTNIPILQSMQEQHGLSTSVPIVIDEYGVIAEQCPGGSAWWISRLERYNVPGLRGNWLSGTELHDFFASLLWKPDPTVSTDTGYWANGDWQVYAYYFGSMTGHRVATTGSIDRLMDSYATVGTDAVRILVGGRQVTGTWQVTVNSLSSVGLPESGTLDITTFQFSYTGGAEGNVGAPTNLGVVAHAYSGNSVSFPIFQTDTTTTWAFEFAVA